MILIIITWSVFKVNLVISTVFFIFWIGISFTGITNLDSSITGRQQYRFYEYDLIRLPIFRRHVFAIIVFKINVSYFLYKYLEFPFWQWRVFQRLASRLKKPLQKGGYQACCGLQYVPSVPHLQSYLKVLTVYLRIIICQWIKTSFCGY